MDFRELINFAKDKKGIKTSDLIHAMNQIDRIAPMTVYKFLDGKSIIGVDNLELILKALESLGVKIEINIK